VPFQIQWYFRDFRLDENYGFFKSKIKLKCVLIFEIICLHLITNLTVISKHLLFSMIRD